MSSLNLSNSSVSESHERRKSFMKSSQTILSLLLTKLVTFTALSILNLFQCVNLLTVRNSHNSDLFELRGGCLDPGGRFYCPIPMATGRIERLFIVGIGW